MHFVYSGRILSAAESGCRPDNILIFAEPYIPSYYFYSLLSFPFFILIFSLKVNYFFMVKKK